MARVARTSGRMAAAAFAGLEEQKLGPPEKQFNRRLVFGPGAVTQTPQAERTQLAACQLQDVCHDAVVLGSSFAEDPAIQAAVLAKLRSSPELQEVMSNWGVEKDALLEVAEIKSQAIELQSELEWQQDLNQDMITHAERLAEERVQLKARVVTLEQENDRLRTTLERIQPDAAAAAPIAAVSELANDQALLRRPRSRAPRQEARAAGAQHRAAPNSRGGEGPTGATIVVQMALAFAAVVVALVVAKKMPAGLRAGAFLGAAMTAFSACRK